MRSGRILVNLLVVATVAASLAFAVYVTQRDYDRSPDRQSGPLPSRAASEVEDTQEAQEDTSSQRPPLCADIDIPTEPPEPVRCRTRPATLVIATDGQPVLLGDTHVRLLSARLRDSLLFVRLRLRNEGSSTRRAGRDGQDVYLNIAGSRLEARPPTSAPVRPHEGVTTNFVFNVPETQRAIIAEAEGRLEIGVTPWHDGNMTARWIGVIRTSAL